MQGASKSRLTETFIKLKRFMWSEMSGSAASENEILTVHGLIFKLIFLSSYDLLTGWVRNRDGASVGIKHFGA
jgi:hypothetical protein